MLPCPGLLQGQGPTRGSIWEGTRLPWFAMLQKVTPVWFATFQSSCHLKMGFADDSMVLGVSCTLPETSIELEKYPPQKEWWISILLFTFAWAKLAQSLPNTLNCRHCDFRAYPGWVCFWILAPVVGKTSQVWIGGISRLGRNKPSTAFQATTKIDTPNLWGFVNVFILVAIIETYETYQTASFLGWNAPWSWKLGVPTPRPGTTWKARVVHRTQNPIRSTWISHDFTSSFANSSKLCGVETSWSL